MSIRSLTVALVCALFVSSLAVQAAELPRSTATTSLRAQGDDEEGGSCGGTERWPVKVGSDPAASNIDITNPKHATIADINSLEPDASINDETTRMDVEEAAYRVSGFIGFFKHETGATGDQDYHIVIVDDSGDYTQGGPHTTPTGHSFVAEIPDPGCFAGKHGDDPETGPFMNLITAVHACFEKNVVGVNGKNIPEGSIPVTITGVAFFDRDHQQVGRGRVHHEPNGRAVVPELHPVLAIQFDNGKPC